MIMAKSKYMPIDIGSTTYDADGHMELFRKLSRTAIALMFYVHVNNKRGKGIVDMDILRVCDVLSMSRRSYYTALSELISNDVITKRNKKTYWVNPRYSFNGDKIEYYRKHNREVRILDNVTIAGNDYESLKECFRVFGYIK